MHPRDLEYLVSTGLSFLFDHSKIRPRGGIDHTTTYTTNIYSNTPSVYFDRTPSKKYCQGGMINRLTQTMEGLIDKIATEVLDDPGILNLAYRRLSLK